MAGSQLLQIGAIAWAAYGMAVSLPYWTIDPGLANAPLALASCIETVVRGTEIPLDDALNLEANHFALLAGSQDMAEGTRAFLEKRPPVFAGR